MANATSIVNRGVVRRTDEFITRSFKTLSAETRIYPNAMIGLGTDGYLAKMDDTASLLFFGVSADNDGGGGRLLPAGTAGDGTLELQCQQPRRLEVTLASVAVTDIGKTCYALFDNAVTLDATATTYANVVGQVVAVVASGVALVELAYDGVAGNARLGAAKTLAATGTITLTKWDMNKTIFITNTAAQSIILPAVAGAAIGGFLQFVKQSTDAQIATLDGADSEEIDAATTLTTVDAGYDCVRVVNNGTRWIITARDIA